MTASILDGKHVASLLKNKIKQKIDTLTQKGHLAPGLAVILIGDDPASCIYVKHKQKACADVGIQSFAFHLAINTTEDELLTLIDRLNHRTDIHGILVQLPLPAHINTSHVITQIDPRKDVDGFHPYNLGCLAQGNPILRPCTPYGIITLLTHYNINIAGQHCVVVGASNIVGRPMALEFLLAKATVTICHSKTKHLEQYIRIADIIVVATGKKDVLNVSWLNPNQIIIDVGIHRLPDGSLRGDVDFPAAKDKVAFITPVPNGIGPMTICTLLHNTLHATSLASTIEDSGTI